MSYYDDCEHGGDPYACPVCVGNHPSSLDVKVSGSFEAKFTGRCQRCSGYIEIGDQAAFVDEELACEGCARRYR